MKISPEGSSSRAVEEEVALNWLYFLMAVEGMFIQWLTQLNLTIRAKNKVESEPLRSSSCARWLYVNLDVTFDVY